MAGWPFRVAVTVTNDRDYAILAEDGRALVQLELDFGKLLVDAGWINQTTGADVRARGFTLDSDSIRVVEYERGFRDFRKRTNDGDVVTTPHAFYPSLFTTTTRGRDFDPATNPIGTVVWYVNAPLRPDEVRYYFVYFSGLEYGKMQPQAHKPLDIAPLKSIGWSALGQTFYGREVGATGNANRLDIHAPYAETTVTFYTYQLGQPRLYEPPPGNDLLVNPIELNNGSTQQPGPFSQYTLPPNSAFKIESDKPIMVAQRGAFQGARPGNLNVAGYAAGNFIPGRDGQFASQTFVYPRYAQTYGTYLADSGETGVATNFQSGTGVSSARPVSSVTNGNVGGVTATIDAWDRVTTSRPILLQATNHLDRDGGLSGQAPALSGAPTGTQFVSQQAQEDTIRVRAFTNASVRVYHPTSQNEQVHPAGPLATTPGATVRAGCASAVEWTVNSSYKPREPYTVLSDRIGQAAPAELFVQAGGKADKVQGYFGGDGGKRVVAQGPLTIFAFFDETIVRAFECTDRGVTEQRLPLKESGQFQLLGKRLEPNGAKATGFYTLVANKPITVMHSAQSDVYGRFVPALPAPLAVTTSPLEFRAHVVDLRSAERPGLQVFKTTGPDRPVEFRLKALNLGHWIGRQNLPDDIKISCTTDKGWDLAGCDGSYRLNSRASETFSVTVTPRNADPGERGVVTVTARSSGAPNVTASIRLIVLVEVTFGLGMWFDVEGGPKTIDPPISLAPDEEHIYKIVFKNTGSVEDSFIIDRVQAQDPQGWSARLVESLADFEETKRITLLPGETQTLLLQVKSPARPVLNFFDVTIKGTSISSATATDKVSSATRIRADIQFRMTVDERTKLALPGLPAKFTLSLLNEGNDIARITLSQEGTLPAGWGARIVDSTGVPITEVNLGLGPPFNVTLEVKPPAHAGAGDIAAVRVAAETTVGEETRRDEQSATVVVRQVHNLTVPTPPEVEAAPGDALPYVLDLTNVGNGHEAVELLRATVRPRWTLDTPDGDSVPVPRNETIPLRVVVRVPEATPAGLVDLNFTLRLSREAQQNVTLPILVRSVRQLSFDLPADMRVAPGQAFSFPVDVRNSGNVRDAATFEATAPEGWTVRFRPPSVNLGPAESTRVTLTVNTTTAAAGGDHPLAITANFASGGTPSATNVTVAVARPQLVLGDPVAQGRATRGELFIVTVPVQNVGGIEAKNVEVALVVDGDTVDLVTIGRILPGANGGTVATLKWFVDRRATDIQVVVNPEATIQQEDPSTPTVASVQFARSIPAPAAWFAVLAAVAIYGWRRHGGST